MSWHVGADYIGGAPIYLEDERHIASVFGRDASEKAKLARLISATPDLLAIADELEDAIDKQTYEARKLFDFEEPDEVMLSVTITAKQFRALSAAISKAGA
jgi:hypothetical protein